MNNDLDCMNKKIIMLSIITLTLSNINADYLLKQKLKQDTIAAFQESTKSSCLDYYNNGSRENGVYTININNKNLDVYCDMTTDGGGWTSIFYIDKVSSPTLTYKYYEDFVKGIGTASGEHWIGLENMHQMTKGGVKLKVLGSTNIIASEYSNFSIGDSTTYYKLYVSGFVKGNNNSFINHSGMGFSTVDNDVDSHTSINCANNNYGNPAGWWFYNCWSTYPFYKSGIHFGSYYNNLRFLIK